MKSESSSVARNDIIYNCNYKCMLFPIDHISFSLGKPDLQFPLIMIILHKPDKKLVIPTGNL